MSQHQYIIINLSSFFIPISFIFPNVLFPYARIPSRILHYIQWLGSLRLLCTVTFLLTFVFDDLDIFENMAQVFENMAHVLGRI